MERASLPRSGLSWLGAALISAPKRLFPGLFPAPPGSRSDLIVCRLDSDGNARLRGYNRVAPAAPASSPPLADVAAPDTATATAAASPSSAAVAAAVASTAAATTPAAGDKRGACVEPAPYPSRGELLTLSARLPDPASRSASAPPLSLNVVIDDGSGALVFLEDAFRATLLAKMAHDERTRIREGFVVSSGIPWLCIVARPPPPPPPPPSALNTPAS